MSFADFYFKRQKSFEVKINEPVTEKLKFTIVIPCFDEDNITETLNSIWDCQRPKSAVEVIIVINDSETTDERIKRQNRKTYFEVQDWIKFHTDPALRFFVFLENDIPSKISGAGYARKLGMDQALYRFNQKSQENGVIFSLDADATVKSNYLREIEKHFDQNPKTTVATIYFEHPVNGNYYASEIYHAIAIYELYLRYYKWAFHFINFPYSYYTVGSCFVVAAKAYAKQGGMNSKQAGEDFYFLHKVFPLGYSYEINTTCVYPSPRISNRVPFGTGPMIDSIVKSGNEDLLTYNFECFKDLKAFLQIIDQLYNITSVELNELMYHLPLPVVDFLSDNDIFAAIEEINQNCTSLKSFKKRFFNWFNAFKVLKYLNATTEKYYSKTDLLPEVEKLAKSLKLSIPEQNNHKSWLELFRNIERRV